MALLDRLFGPKNDPKKDAMIPLYDQVVAHARQPHWYIDGGVADNLDGRFEILAAILSLLLLRLEREDNQAENSVYLTEIFVDDMDGQLREIGVGDMIVGKHMGKIMSALGGKLSAYRDALSDPSQMPDVIARNIFAGEQADEDNLAYLVDAIQKEMAQLDGITTENLVGGNADW